MTEPGAPNQQQVTPAKRLTVVDVAPSALATVGAFMAALFHDGSLRGTIAGLLSGGAFFTLSLCVLLYLGRYLVPGVLGGAAAGVVGGLVYWLVGRPDVTPVGAAGLGAIGGALVFVVQLVFVGYRLQLKRSHDDLEALAAKIDTQLDATLSKADGDTRRVKDSDS